MARPKKCPPISRIITGAASASPIQNRRCMSMSSAFGPTSAVVSSGSSAMPQRGQAPGPFWRIWGCIGQVKIVALGVGSGASDVDFAYRNGSEMNFSRHPPAAEVVSFASVLALVLCCGGIDLHAAHGITRLASAQWRYRRRHDGTRGGMRSLGWHEVSSLKTCACGRDPLRGCSLSRLLRSVAQLYCVCEAEERKRNIARMKGTVTSDRDAFAVDGTGCASTGCASASLCASSSIGCTAFGICDESAEGSPSTHDAAMSRTGDVAT